MQKETALTVWRVVLLLVLTLTLFGGEPEERLFSVGVKPLLTEKCFVCHGGAGLKLGDLDLTSRAAMLAGGASGNPALQPGDAAASSLYRAATWSDPKLQMPPKENDRLSEEQMGKIRDWIDAGAPWPDEETQRRHVADALQQKRTADGILVRTSGGTSDAWTNRRYKEEDLWAYRPLAEVEPPADGHPIDAFHRARLTGAGIAPAPPAVKQTLLRRAFYDLTGLPPTPEQAREFLGDESADAWEKLIERLLSSPRYGERWGQHWLDVARYADTAGNSNDFERSNAWRYRDYVIRSFNADKPYNQFVREQLAGDELRPDDPEMLVAAGFLRMGSWGSAMVPKAIARQAYLDDVVNSVGQTFLSTPLRCAKCHDHKFDPVPTRDYYRFYAAFATTQMAERPAAFLPEENVSGFEEGRVHVKALKDFATQHKQALNAKMEAADRQWYAARGMEYIPAAKRKEIPDDKKPPRHHGLSQEEEGRLKVRQQDEWIWGRRLERYEPMAQSVFNGPDYIPGNARKLRVPEKLDASWRPQNAILAGGNVAAKTDPVTPGILSAVYLPEITDEGDPWVVTDEQAGRRSEVADWITDPRNPLSTRSIVNRVWQYHFGRGLAATPNNFGGSGGKPTHPDLLDWLARDFVEHGWSIKRLHRTIMTSDLYRQSTERTDLATVIENDPDNALLAYFEPRRLTAEEIRDSMLAVSGELNLTMGGVPALPEINMEVALQPRMIQFSIAPAYQPSRTPEERNRRSIYTYRVRGQADPFLEVFNSPNPNDSCERRNSSSVSPQALTLLNSGAATDRSIAFALRLEREADAVPDQIGRAFELAFGRPPSPAELSRLTGYIGEMRAHHHAHQPKPVKYPTRVTRSLVEEFSGKPFEYEEWLNRFEDYVPDVKAGQVEPATRALADLCLLLFNSNEFVYVY